MARETIEIGKRWLFGRPILTAVNNGQVNWSRGTTSPLDQKSPTGWLANLYGGTQTGDDYARVEIPVSELPTTRLLTALWTYYQTNEEVYGVNMVIWLHDPTDNDKRVEVTQAPSGVTLEKGAGWNAHELDTTVTQFFYYGEGVSGSGLTAGTQYTWAQFQADVIFGHWTIYKISFEWGWYSTGVFEDAWVADIKINNQIIQLEPDSGGTGRIVHRYVEHANDVVALTIAPKTPFRLKSIDIHLSAALATGELVTITKDSGYGTGGYGDTVLFSEDLFIGTRLSYHGAFGEDYEFGAADELDIALSANSLNRNIGIDVTYQTVFS